MRTYTIYMEDDMGNRVRVSSSYPGDIFRDETDDEAREMMGRIVEAKKKLASLDAEGDFWLKYNPRTDGEVVRSHKGVMPLKGAKMMSDFDILTQILGQTAEEANETVAKMKRQKLEELKLQVMANTPHVFGVGLPEENSDE